MEHILLLASSRNELERAGKGCRVNLTKVDGANETKRSSRRDSGRLDPHFAGGGRSVGIDRGSTVPLYVQLKTILKSGIERQGIGPGEPLPGDHQLCATYGVSRTVVRQALSELEYEGVINRVKGRGTFVAEPKVGEGLFQSLTGLYDDTLARGGRLRSDVLRFEVVPADSIVAEQLQLSLGEDVIVLERLRFVDSLPWVFNVTHLPLAIAPDLLTEDLTNQSLYGILRQRYGVQIARGKRSLEASVASTSLARILQVAVGDPVLVLRNQTFDSEGRPIEVFVGFHRGDRSRFDVELTQQSGAAAPTMVLT